MSEFKWQNDNWASIETEEGKVWDMNLLQRRYNNYLECRLDFVYPTYINDEGVREVNTRPKAMQSVTKLLRRKANE